MCGRYYIDETAEAEIRKLVMRAEKGIQMYGKMDIYPGSRAPVIIKDRNYELSEELFPWGFPGFQNKGLVINARAESVAEKKMFRDSVQNRRCVIPAAGFYEWNKKKEKYTFTKTDGEILYFAGIYNLYDYENRFVILTTQANESMVRVHDRMPLILSKEEIEDWILDGGRAEEMLGKDSGELVAQSDYEQQVLKFE